MISLNSVETYIDEENNCYGSFVVEPLEAGQGITLGNALRRTMLSDILGCAITGVRINNVKHEFATIEGVREDILEILLNLKEIIFKSSFTASKKEFSSTRFHGYLHVQGPGIITASNFQLPKGVLTIMNPNQYICTLVEDVELYLEIDIEYGTGYRLVEEMRKKSGIEPFYPSRPSTLLVDGVFMPIRRVNYKVKLIHDSQGNIKESLFLEVLTNGSITPRRGIFEGLKLLFNLFVPLFNIPGMATLANLAKRKLILKKYGEPRKIKKELPSDLAQSLDKDLAIKPETQWKLFKIKKKKRRKKKVESSIFTKEKNLMDSVGSSSTTFVRSNSVKQENTTSYMEDKQLSVNESVPTSNDESVVPKKRGRKPKQSSGDLTSQVTQKPILEEGNSSPEPKKRGRKPKQI